MISETFDFNLILLCNPILTSILSEDEKMFSSGLNSRLFERRIDNLHKRNQILKGFAEKKIRLAKYEAVVNLECHAEITDPHQRKRNSTQKKPNVLELHVALLHR